MQLPSFLTRLSDKTTPLFIMGAGAAFGAFFLGIVLLSQLDTPLTERDYTVSAAEESEMIADDDSRPTLQDIINQRKQLALGGEDLAHAKQKTPQTFPHTESITVLVKAGDTLAEILQSEGVTFEDTLKVIAKIKKHFQPRNIRVGQQFTLELERHKDFSRLQVLELEISDIDSVRVKAQGEDFTSERVKVKTSARLARAGGTIQSSFYEAGADAGLPAAIIMELMKAYSYDVDFQRDIKPGQALEVLFEQTVADKTNKVIGSGDLKYAALTLKNKPIEIYKYTDKEGETGYYRSDGASIRKALLKTPINGARISSSYGMRRHPVLGYSKMHKGMDFAARRGTPIYAAGDGVVKKADRHGGYGNYVRIRHNGTYDSAYAHMSRFASGIRAGKRVKQGQVIGYVGSTGRSTGPHLHYEILKHGRQVNPSGVKFQTGRKLSGTELANFKKEVTGLRQQMAELPRMREQLASAE